MHIIDAVIRLQDNVSNVIKNVDNNLTKFSKHANYVGNDLNRVGKNLGNIGKGLMTGITLPVAGASIAMAKTAIDCESSFNGIRKTVDATDEQFKKLEQDFDNLSLDIPIDLTELHHIGELAGQLGVDAKHITKFSKTIAELGVTTNLTGEEGASSLAKFSNIMGMSLDNIDKLGSCIVDLGNHTSTTEANIVAMAMRLAGAGKQVNLTEADIMGMSATMSSLGIEAEAGGSAMSKFMMNVNTDIRCGNENLTMYAKMCGTTRDKLKNIWKKDSIQGLEMIIDGFGRFRQKGGNLSMLFDELDIKDIRMKDTLMRMSNAQGSLTKNVKLGTKAWNENNALQKEAEVRFAETKGQIQLLKNHLKMLCKNIGNMFLPYIRKSVDYLKNLIDKINKLDPTTQQMIVKIALISAAIAPCILALAKLTGTIGKTYKSMSKLAGNIKKAGGILKYITSPAFLVVGALLLIAGVAFLVIKNWDKISKCFKKVGKVLSEFTGIGNKEIKTFINIVKRFGNTVGKHIKKMFNSFKPLGKKLGGLFKSVGKLLKTLKPVLMPILAFVTGVFVAKLVFVFTTLVHKAIAIVTTITGVVGGIIKIFKGIIDFFIGVFTGDWHKCWEGIKEIFGGAIDSVKAIWDGIIDFFSAPVDAVIDILDSLFHDKIKKVKEVWEGLKTFFKHPIKATVSLFKNGNLSGVKTDGEHAVGANRIPYNGYLAELHEGERVLTKKEAKNIDNRHNSNIVINFGDVTVQDKNDMDKIANAIVSKLKINCKNLA